ncbi:MAG: tetratricopeptide repeat protein [Parvibaculum sp.]
MATDALDLHISGGGNGAAAHLMRGVAELQCFIGDPVGAANAAIAADRGTVMAHVLKGYLYGLSTEPTATPVVRAAHAAAASLPANAREKAHVAALGHLAAGQWHDAGRALADLAAEYPRDALALQAGHQIDFFTGNASMLRGRIERALPAWDAGMAGYHAILGMRAFGLEENGEYEDAERAGRQAIELNPRDGWAQHAVAHVMEMQCRQREGIAWMRGNAEHWTKESFLQVHNWWHLALYHFDLGETDEVLALYDGPIFGARSTVALNMVDASAILWRLHLGGVDVGDRWTPLAAQWALHAGVSAYAFNDMHAMMAFVAGGGEAAAARLLAAQDEAVAGAGAGDNAGFTRDVGRPIARALHAFGRGDYAETVQLLSAVRARAHSFGGSHAQRDVIDLTLIEAAIRSGDRAMAGRLTRERALRREASPMSGILRQRADAIAAR